MKLLDPTLSGPEEKDFCVTTPRAKISRTAPKQGLLSPQRHLYLGTNDRNTYTICTQLAGASRMSDRDPALAAASDTKSTVPESCKRPLTSFSALQDVQGSSFDGRALEFACDKSNSRPEVVTGRYHTSTRTCRENAHVCDSGRAKGLPPPKTPSTLPSAATIPDLFAY